MSLSTDAVSEGLLPPAFTWLEQVNLKAGEETCSAAGLLCWESAAEPSGLDFAAEVESVSRLYPHLDSLPAELTGGVPGQEMAQQAALCGGTRLALGAGPSPPGSPADQRLMSPSDALMSPDPSLSASPEQQECLSSLKISPSSPIFEFVHAPSHVQATSLESFNEKRKDSFDISATSSHPEAPSPASEYVSFSNEEASASIISYTTPSPDVTVTDATNTDITDTNQPSPVIEFLSDISAGETSAEDEHTQMIDQALEDLKTLESMCGISSSEQTAPLAASTPARQTKRKLKTATVSSAPASTVSASASAAEIAVKEEPMDADIEIVEEVPAPPKRARRRPPRVAVTPAAAAAPAPAPAQIVIVLTGEQLAGIQQSGQIVLNAAALQPALQLAAAAGTSAAETPAAAGGRAGGKVRTIAKSATGRTAVTASGKATDATQYATVTKSATVTTKTATVTTKSATVTSKSATVTSSEVPKPQPGRRPRVVVKPEPGSSGTGPSAVRKAIVRSTVKQEASRRAQKARGKARKTDPLSGWAVQKQPQAAWEYPMLGPFDDTVGFPGPSVGVDAGIPDDLQDLLLDSPESVPALPGDDANTLLEDLISGSVRENPELFGDVTPPQGSPLDGDGLGKAAPALQPPPQQQQQPLFNLSPAPQQVSLEAWVPTLSPASCEPGSPLGFGESSAEPLPGPDWSPAAAAPPSSRRAARPRPYDKPGRRQQLTEEERRLRKKEQNKNAATRYRQKKKEEHELVSSDQEMLEARNKQLRARVGSLTKELLYLKQLMREVLRHKQAAV